MNFKNSSVSLLFGSVLALYLTLGVQYVFRITHMLSYNRYLPSLIHLIVVVLIGCVAGLMLKKKIAHAYPVAITATLYTAVIAETVGWLRYIHVAVALIAIMAVGIIAIAVCKKFFAFKRLSMLQKSLIAAGIWIVLFIVGRIFSLYFTRILFPY